MYRRVTHKTKFDELLTHGWQINQYFPFSSLTLECDWEPLFMVFLFRKKPKPLGWNKKHPICAFTQISIKHQYFLYVFTSENPLGTQETTLCLPDLPAIAVIYTMKTNESLPKSKILFNWRQLGSTELCNMILNSSSCPHCFAYWTIVHRPDQQRPKTKGFESKTWI